MTATENVSAYTPEDLQKQLTGALWQDFTERCQGTAGNLVITVDYRDSLAEFKLTQEYQAVLKFQEKLEENGWESWLVERSEGWIFKSYSVVLRVRAKGSTEPEPRDYCEGD